MVGVRIMTYGCRLQKKNDKKMTREVVRKVKVFVWSTEMTVRLSHSFPAKKKRQGAFGSKSVVNTRKNPQSSTHITNKTGIH